MLECKRIDNDRIEEDAMTTETVKLKNGEKLVIKTLHPPLHDYASKVGCWGDISDDLLNGKLTDWLFTPYFVGEIDERSCR